MALAHNSLLASEAKAEYNCVTGYTEARHPTKDLPYSSICTLAPENVPAKALQLLPLFYQNDCAYDRADHALLAYRMHAFASSSFTSQHPYDPQNMASISPVRQYVFQPFRINHQSKTGELYYNTVLVEPDWYQTMLDLMGVFRVIICFNVCKEATLGNKPLRILIARPPPAYLNDPAAPPQVFFETVNWHQTLLPTANQDQLRYCGTWAMSASGINGEQLPRAYRTWGKYMNDVIGRKPSKTGKRDTTSSMRKRTCMIFLRNGSLPFTPNVFAIPPNISQTYGQPLVTSLFSATIFDRKPTDPAGVNDVEFIKLFNFSGTRRIKRSSQETRLSELMLCMSQVAPYVFSLERNRRLLGSQNRRNGRSFSELLTQHPGVRRVLANDAFQEPPTPLNDQYDYDDEDEIDNEMDEQYAAHYNYDHMIVQTNTIMGPNGLAQSTDEEIIDINLTPEVIALLRQEYKGHTDEIFGDYDEANSDADASNQAQDGNVLNDFGWLLTDDNDCENGNASTDLLDSVMNETDQDQPGSTEIYSGALAAPTEEDKSMQLIGTFAEMYLEDASFVESEMSEFIIPYAELQQHHLMFDDEAVLQESWIDEIRQKHCRCNGELCLITQYVHTEPLANMVPGSTGSVCHSFVKQDCCGTYIYEPELKLEKGHLVEWCMFDSCVLDAVPENHTLADKLSPILEQIEPGQNFLFMMPVTRDFKFVFINPEVVVNMSSEPLVMSRTRWNRTMISLSPANPDIARRRSKNQSKNSNNNNNTTSQTAVPINMELGSNIVPGMDAGAIHGIMVSQSYMDFRNMNPGADMMQNYNFHAASGNMPPSAMWTQQPPPDSTGQNAMERQMGYFKVSNNAPTLTEASQQAAVLLQYPYKELTVIPYNGPPPPTTTPQQQHTRQRSRNTSRQTSTTMSTSTSSSVSTTNYTTGAVTNTNNNNLFEQRLQALERRKDLEEENNALLKTLLGRSDDARVTSDSVQSLKTVVRAHNAATLEELNGLRRHVAVLEQLIRDLAATAQPSDPALLEKMFQYITSAQQAQLSELDTNISSSIIKLNSSPSPKKSAPSFSFDKQTGALRTSALDIAKPSFKPGYQEDYAADCSNANTDNDQQLENVV